MKRVSVFLQGGGRLGVGIWCLIGIYLPHTHKPCTPFVWMAEHSPESHAGQTGISLQISRDSPISLTQESFGTAAWGLFVFHILQACYCSQDDYLTQYKYLKILKSCCYHNVHTLQSGLAYHRGLCAFSGDLALYVTSALSCYSGHLILHFFDRFSSTMSGMTLLAGRYFLRTTQQLKNRSIKSL